MHVEPVNINPYPTESIKISLEAIHKLDPTSKIERLTKLFTSVAPSTNRTDLAEILACYGKTLYAKADYDAARRAHVISFVLLAGRDKLPPLFGFDQAHFAKIFSSTLQESIDSTNVPEAFETALCSLSSLDHESLAPDDQLQLANTLRYIEHSYQNLPRYKALPYASNDLFEQTVHFAEAILQGLLKKNLPDTLKSKVEDELFELEYNTSHYLYRRKHPKDIDGVLLLLEKLLERYVNAPQKQSRILNLLSCFTPPSQVERVYVNSKQALQIKKDNPTLFEPFLIALNKSNFVSAAFKHSGKTETVEDLVKLQQEAAEFANGEIAQGNYNDYLPVIFINQAKLMQHLGKKQEALAACDRADFIIKNCPEPDIDDIVALKQMREHLQKQEEI